MIQTAYVSRAAESMLQEDLLSLLQQCLANNEASGVTGMLLYGNETFLQVLEGEEAVLDVVIDKIRKDPRHSKIQFLYRKPIDKRQYADWSMGFKRVSAQGLQAVGGLPDFGFQDFNFDYLIEHEAVVETLVEHFRALHWDPLIRELDAKDKVIEYLKKALTHTRGCVGSSAVRPTLPRYLQAAPVEESTAGTRRELVHDAQHVLGRIERRLNLESRGCERSRERRSHGARMQRNTQGLGRAPGELDRSGTHELIERGFGRSIGVPAAEAVIADAAHPGRQTYECRLAVSGQQGQEMFHQ
jgi:hypothetical protein